MEQEPLAIALQQRQGDLHGDNWRLELDDSIEANITATGWHQYIRSSAAEFRCSKCRHWWPSNKVLVLFHFHLDKGNHRGVVKVRRFRQECRNCSQATMEKPSFKQSNIEVMVEKLVEKIRMRCYGENFGKRNRSLNFQSEVDGPHESSHCEACKNGICQQGN